MKTQAVHSRFAAARRILLFWTFFIGLGAVGGACAMLLLVSILTFVGAVVP